MGPQKAVMLPARIEAATKSFVLEARILMPIVEAKRSLTRKALSAFISPKAMMNPIPIAIARYGSSFVRTPPNEP